MHPAAGLHVVELEDGSAFLGVVRYDGDLITVITGRNGRPPQFTAAEVDDLIPAELHPGVSWSLPPT